VFTRDAFPKWARSRSAVLGRRRRVGVGIAAVPGCGAGPSRSLTIAYSASDPSRPKPMESQLTNTQVQADEVPPDPLCFLLGRDHDGYWIVRETHGLCGGLFANENAATRYAKFESAGRRSTIRLVPDPIELNCSS
jgi:hypothetical protein